MSEFMRGALGTDGGASVPSAGDEGKEEKSCGGNWWSQLSANKHLTQDPDLKKAIPELGLFCMYYMLCMACLRFSCYLYY